MQNKQLPHNHGHHYKSLQAGMPKMQTFENVSDILKLMSDPKRLQIFWILCHCEECVINISALLDMSSPATSHHLKALKNAGLIISRREGKEVYYTAAKTVRTRVLHDMIEQIVELTCPMEESFVKGNSYDSQVDVINEIHSFLTENLKNRYTIDELSQKFHINRTTLKAVFKRVFGQPVASYMKEYRMRRAAELLVQGDMPISQIAVEVGYENQSKFTSAFKDITGLLPKEFRKGDL